jgi:bis(5'-nucleosidyl)-tetraphosphatase
MDKQIKKDQSFGVIPIKQDGRDIKFLLVKHKAGHWGFPKGHPKEGENEVDCASRELREETGINSFSLKQEIKFIENYTCEQNGEYCDKTVTYFLGFIDGDFKQRKEFAEEIPGIALLGYEQSRTTLTHSEAKKILDDAYAILQQNKL